MLRKSVAILAMLLSFMATEAVALGLGRVSVESALNQPLRVRIEVLQLGDTRLDDVDIQIASPEDFQRFNIERAIFLNNIRFRTEATPQGNYVVLTTNQIVREPYLSFILETRWSNGRLLSEHTILLDLPVFEEEPATSAPVRRPISTVLTPNTSQTTPQVTQPTVTAPASTAPSVQPVIEPEVIAPSADEESPTEVLETQQAEVDQEEATVQSADALEAEPEQPEPLGQTVDDPAEDVDANPGDDSQIAAEEVQVTEENEPEVSVVEETGAEETVADAAIEEDSSSEEDLVPETITTGPADTLSDIALRVRPDDSVSIQQTMIAIQALNPDAFADGNINRMRSGEVLRVPSLSDIQATDQREAVAEVARQNQQASADIQPLAAPSNTVPAQDEEIGGQLSVVTGDPDADTGESGSGIADDADDEELDQRIEELQTQLALREEEADRARLEREELESRLAELDEQIAAAQEIIRLQDLQLAQLQQSLADAAAQAEIEAQQQAATTPPPAVTQPPATGFVDSLMRTIMGNSMVLIAVVVVVIILLAVLLVRRNKAKQPDEEGLESINEDDFTGVTEAKEESKEAEGSAMGAEFHDYKEADLDSELDDIISVGDQSQETQSGDGEQPVLDAEQDIYSQTDLLLQHEQYEQAALLLQDAIAENPTDIQLQLKQLEVSAAKSDLSAFEMQAEALQSENNPEINDKIDQLRSSLAASSVEQPVDTYNTENSPQSQKDETASFLDDLGIDLDAFEDDAFQLTDDEPAKADEDTSSLAEVSLDDMPEESEPGEMDLTFDLVPEADAGTDKPELDADSLTESDSADEVDVTDVESEAPAEPDDTSLETGDEESEVEEDEIESFEFDSDAVAVAPEASAEDSEDLDIDTLEFDVEEPATPEASEPEEELDLETFSFDPPEVEESASTSVEESEESAVDDENALDFDFDKSEITEAPAEKADEEVEAFDFDLNDAGADTVVEKADLEDDEVSLDLDDSDEPLVESSSETSLEGNDNEFDFDLNELEIDENEIAASDVEIDLSDDDFLDLDAESEGSTEPAKEIQDSDAPKSDDVEFDFDDEFEVPETSADTVVESAADDDLDFLADDDAEIESFDDVVDSELLSDEDETATKLELAYAYQKMGDAEGAREILQEVISEGSDAQVKEAKDLIETLDSNQE